ncbi:MAG: asparagine synthase C-terminal domain-containing protein, partial [Lachnospiraceae bacterium]|nr:asparagine synthase C-terminal domain-containing protein [Lachnospiraceae bacterium]
FLRGTLRSVTGRLVSDIDDITKYGNFSLADNVHTLNHVLNADTYKDYYLAMGDRREVYRLTGRGNANIDTVNDGYQYGLLPDPESDLMLMDMQQYLPDDILAKVDRAGMYYSLETRIPLLDADVMELAWSLPLSYKMSDGITKKPLRNILYRYVPKELMDRPKKGFSVPVSKWLREGEMLNRAESVLADARLLASDYIDMRVFDSIWQKYKNDGQFSPVIWYVFVLMKWLRYRSDTH